MEGDARNKWHGKIYTLVHAELLDYDVSHKVEQSLEKHCHALEGNLTYIYLTCATDALNSLFVIGRLSYLP